MQRWAAAIVPALGLAALVAASGGLGADAERVGPFRVPRGATVTAVVPGHPWTVQLFVPGDVVGAVRAIAAELETDGYEIGQTVPPAGGLARMQRGIGACYRVAFPTGGEGSTSAYRLNGRLPPGTAAHWRECRVLAVRGADAIEIVGIFDGRSQAHVTVAGRMRSEVEQEDLAAAELPWRVHHQRPERSGTPTNVGVLRVPDGASLVAPVGFDPWCFGEVGGVVVGDRDLQRVLDDLTEQARARGWNGEWRRMRFFGEETRTAVGSIPGGGPSITISARSMNASRALVSIATCDG